jgi:serine/threonine protein kinase
MHAGEGADVWSLGIILYVLVCCDYPFGFDGVGGQPTQHVLSRIKEGRFSFPTDKVSLSPEIMSLITGILTVDLDARFKISDILAHPWFTAGDAYAPEGGATDRSIAWELAPQLPNVPSIESVEFEFDSDDGE